MKHLTGDEMSALLDGELKGLARQRAEAHLASCEPCRNALGDLAAGHASLKGALAHDPGEAYFATFAAGVQDRIRTDKALRARGAGAGRWFSRPRNVVLAGAAAAVILGAGVVLIASQDVTRDLFRDRSVVARALQPAPQPAPSDASAPTGAPIVTGDEERATSSRPAPATAKQSVALESDAAPQSASAPRGAMPARAQRVRRNENGEDVPVEPQRQFAAPPPARQAPDAGAGPSTVAKLREQRTVTPMRNETSADAQKREVATAKPEVATAKPEAKTRASASDRLRAASARAKELAKASPPAAPSNEALIAEPKRDIARKDGGVASGNAMPAPSAASDVMREEEGRVRVCGEVRDAAGRPIAGATVTLLSGAAMTRTDERGEFCFSAPAGEDSVVVARVGFRPARATVRIAQGESLPAIALESVSALGDLRGGARPSRVDAPDVGPATTLGAFPDSLRPEAVRAAGALARAQRTGAAGGFDIAATMWERLVRRSNGTSAEVAARERLAEARYRAWEAGPTSRRAELALGSLTSFIARAPMGAGRDRAVRWVDRVKLGR